METNQGTEGASGIWNWFLPSFHRRTNLGELYLSHFGGNTERTELRSGSSRWRDKRISRVMADDAPPLLVQKSLQRAPQGVGLGRQASCTGCLPKWAPNPFMELGICDFYRLWTVARVLNCERRDREGEMNEWRRKGSRTLRKDLEEGWRCYPNHQGRKKTPKPKPKKKKSRKSSVESFT